MESALDDVVRGKYPAALVDTSGLEFYKDLKPGVFARLKVLVQSEVFPPVVIVYHKGALNDATLARIRNGLRGRQDGIGTRRDENVAHDIVRADTGRLRADNRRHTQGVSAGYRRQVTGGMPWGAPSYCATPRDDDQKASMR